MDFPHTSSHAASTFQTQPSLSSCIQATQNTPGNPQKNTEPDGTERTFKESSTGSTMNRTIRGIWQQKKKQEFIFDQISAAKKRFDKELFPSDADVKPVKAAGIYLLTTNPKDGKAYILLGKMKKDDPNKKGTHIFNGTYSGFSGKAEPGEHSMDTAAREFTEETDGIFGPQEAALSRIAQDDTMVIKNASWAKFPVATYVVKTDHMDYRSIYDASKNHSQDEIQQIDLVSLGSIWDAVDNYVIPGTEKTWREYNSPGNLKTLFAPLAERFSGVELEIEKNKLKRHLPVLTDRGEKIEIADYAVRTLLEGEGLGKLAARV